MAGGPYEYIATLVDGDVANKLKDNSSTPRWMSDLIYRSDKLKHRGLDKIVIEFGERQEDSYNIFRDIISSSRSSHMEMICSADADYATPRHRKSGLRGVFVERWEVQRGLFV
ncbi:MAG: hypothetical protein EOQ39_22120 [Mesorhizobium sp.]|uniref:hypothetical protein n=1 Tax=Mesorhizobium sp. TaxID=1871066 RepID=UPI000FE7CAE0|nr:hypothetical protein [Mesorhizobium sp.]RWB00879.1 MAG: hypothetical protein EOQ37_27180 [Mesorhizobium sp.]RWB12869.1 MAG: hypothetical protein EOQ39_22120 [Mesorhizobium sp.]